MKRLKEPGIEFFRSILAGHHRLWPISRALAVIFLANSLFLWWRGESVVLSMLGGTVFAALTCFLVHPLLKSREQAIERLTRSEERVRRGYEDMLQFAYIAAHDLQSPLATISGFSGLLKERYAAQLDEDGQTYIDFIEREAQGASRLVGGLLEFSRIGTGEKRFKTVKIRALVERVTISLRLDLAGGGGTIEVKWLPDVVADETQMERVFRNLICNAIKYRQPGRPLQVVVSARRGENEVIFCVADNGLGIPAGYQEKVFAIFGRLHDGRIPGDGIGLTIVKRIVERHGGQVSFTSQVDRGSRFYFSIPD